MCCVSFKLFQNVLCQLKLFQNVLCQLELFQSVLRQLKLFQNVLRQFKLFQSVLCLFSYQCKSVLYERGRTKLHNWLTTKYRVRQK